MAVATFYRDFLDAFHARDDAARSLQIATHSSRDKLVQVHLARFFMRATHAACRAFLGALLPHWHLTAPLTDAAAPLEGRLIWLTLLRQLLALDAAAVLRPAQQSSAFVLNSYLTILNSRCLTHPEAADL